MERIALGIATAMLITVSGCIDSPVSSTAPGDLTITGLAQEMERLSKAAEELIGEAQCYSPDDCRTMGWGSKPCGGPATHLVYSAAETDVAQLQAVADRYHDVHEEHNAKTGAMSDCSALNFIPPQVGCVDGHCVRTKI